MVPKLLFVDARRLWRVGERNCLMADLVKILYFHLLSYVLARKCVLQCAVLIKTLEQALLFRIMLWYTIRLSLDSYVYS